MAVFMRDESGSAMIDWVVVTASVVGLALAALGLLSPTPQPTAIGVAAAVPAAPLPEPGVMRPMPRAAAHAAQTPQTDDSWIDRRLERLMNELTEDQLRNQFAIWIARAADSSHVHHAKAADQLALLAIAMEARNVQP